jgi:hypothetical protein
MQPQCLQTILHRIVHLLWEVLLLIITVKFNKYASSLNLVGKPPLLN